MLVCMCVSCIILCWVKYVCCGVHTYLEVCIKDMYMQVHVSTHMCESLRRVSGVLLHYSSPPYFPRTNQGPSLTSELGLWLASPRELTVFMRTRTQVLMFAHHMSLLSHLTSLFYPCSFRMLTSYLIPSSQTYSVRQGSLLFIFKQC